MIFQIWKPVCQSYAFGSYYPTDIWYELWFSRVDVFFYLTYNLSRKPLDLYQCVLFMWCIIWFCFKLRPSYVFEKHLICELINIISCWWFIFPVNWFLLCFLQLMANFPVWEHQWWVPFYGIFGWISMQLCSYVRVVWFSL